MLVDITKDVTQAMIDYNKHPIIRYKVELKTAMPRLEKFTKYIKQAERPVVNLEAGICI